MPMQWDKYRSVGGEINLLSAYHDRYGVPSLSQEAALLEIMSLQPINSRQAAAIAIATVYTFGVHRGGTQDDRRGSNDESFR